MVPAATPLTTVMLKTSVVGMSGAVTSTTTVATDVVETSATRTRAASFIGPTPVGSQAATTRRQTVVASERNSTRDIRIDLCQGSRSRGQLLYRIRAPQKRQLQSCEMAWCGNSAQL